MQKNRRTVTTHDVAKTVPVSVLDDLRYTRNLATRSMRSFKKKMIGLLMPDTACPFAIQVRKGESQAIAESEFDQLVYTTSVVSKNGSASHQQKYVSLPNNSITDNVISVAPATHKFLIGAPIVSIDNSIRNLNYASVDATQEVTEAMDYLLGLRHQRTGFITGHAHRLKGYRGALETDVRQIN